MDTKLYAFMDLVMEPDVVRGRDYDVLYEDDKTLTIRNEHGELHHFSKDENDDAYFGRWFFYVKE